MNDEAKADADAGEPRDGGARSRRTKLIAGIVAVVAIAGIGYGVYWFLVARFVESTDDAYVGGNIVQITPQVAGTVVAIGADNTEHVKAGQTLVQLDKADAEVVLQQAESTLARTVRDVRTLYATNTAQQATVDARRTDVARARDDLARREALAKTGAISREELQHARDAVRSAEAALAAAEQQSAAARALVDRTRIDQHPDVMHAAAAVKSAYLALARTTLPAPVAGFVAKRDVQLGEHVSPGTPLMAVVPLDDVWVDANFKEAQLATMRVGQPATLTADVYGGKVEYHGRVVGIGAGTGAAFSLLPPQNATGNWIKIVQRVPVRIELDGKELADHPLQVGLSMQVAVDTHDRRGGRLRAVARETPAYRTDVYDALDREADARVKSIIAQNSAAGASAAGANLARDGADARTRAVDSPRRASLPAPRL